MIRTLPLLFALALVGIIPNAATAGQREWWNEIWPKNGRTTSGATSGDILYLGVDGGLGLAGQILEIKADKDERRDNLDAQFRAAAVGRQIIKDAGGSAGGTTSGTADPAPTTRTPLAIPGEEYYQIENSRSEAIEVLVNGRVLGVIEAGDVGGVAAPIGAEIEARTSTTKLEIKGGKVKKSTKTKKVDLALPPATASQTVEIKNEDGDTVTAQILLVEP